jgi:multidrug efflux pump subunit AcrB
MKLSALALIVSVQDGIVIAGDGLNIQVKRARAAIEGVDSAVVGAALNDYLSGTVATQLPQTAHCLI